MGIVPHYCLLVKKNVIISRFLAFRCVQCSIGLADVNVKKHHQKMKIDIEQPGSNTWFFLYPKAIFFLCTDSSHDLSLTSAHLTRNKHDQLPTYAPLSLPKGQNKHLTMFKNKEVIPNEKSSVFRNKVSQR